MPSREPSKVSERGRSRPNLFDQHSQSRPVAQDIVPEPDALVLETQQLPGFELRKYRMFRSVKFGCSNPVLEAFALKPCECLHDARTRGGRGVCAYPAAPQRIHDLAGSNPCCDLSFRELISVTDYPIQKLQIPYRRAKLATQE